MLVLSCSPIYKCNSNGNNMKESEQRHEMQVSSFSEIPINLLENLDKMGIDSSSIHNEYEGRYLNFIFKIDPKDFNLVGKKVGFKLSKIYYFKSTRERYYSNSGVIGNSSLYIFDTIQKAESGGYDAAVTCWDIFVIPIEKVVKRVKKWR